MGSVGGEWKKRKNSSTPQDSGFINDLMFISAPLPCLPYRKHHGEIGR
jgi:hypothetical protein